MRKTVVHHRLAHALAHATACLLFCGTLQAQGHTKILERHIRIPELYGTTLAGQKVSLPKDLAGRPGVLLLGFGQEARPQVADWGKRLADRYRAQNTVVFYEMAMIGGVPRLLRGWVTGKIRDSVPVRAQTRFLTVPDHEAEWKTAAAYSVASDAYVLVVDPTGQVLWQTHGPVTDARMTEAARQVDLIGQR